MSKSINTINTRTSLSSTGGMISTPSTQVAGIKLVVDLKLIAARSIPQMCIRQAGILCLRWNLQKVIMSTAIMKWLELSTAFSQLLLSMQETMDIVDMVTFLTRKPNRSLRAIMSPGKTAFMVCLARVSKILTIEVRIDTTGLRLINTSQPTTMVSITVNNTQWQTFFKGFKIITMVILFMHLSTTKPLELMAKKCFLLYTIKLGLLMPLYSMIEKLKT